MYKTIRIIGFFLCCSLALLAQNTNSWKTAPRLKAPMQEKLYLHFDKPAYVAGERMWFRAYLANAFTHIPDTSSCAVYVELINNADSLIQRIKIPHKQGMFAGSISLSDMLPEGNYSVRAYTNWMRNAGSDYFFNQSFFVGNSLSSQVVSTINYRFTDKKKAVAEIQFMQGNSPLSSKKISYYINVSGEPKTPRTITTNSDGKITIEYNPSKLEIKKPLIHVAYKENLSSYERNYLLPASEDFDCQFFPEGGSLLAGENNRVAFKAIKQNGLSTEISGIIYDENSKKLSEFHSTHLGMGNFYFSPDSGKQYYAVVKNKAGNEKRFDLPKTSTTGVSINATQLKNKIYVGIRSKLKADSLFLIAHSRSSVFYNKMIMDVSKPIAFTKSDLPPGIISFMLFDKYGHALSERLMFIRPDSLPTANIQFDKAEYEKRERVNCHVQILDTKGNPVEGSFSLSVTDASDVILDPTEQNLVNYLLLSSDLRGHIEQPNAYFDRKNKQAVEQLDILMQTQAWRRFDVEQLLNGKNTLQANYLEKGQAVSGLVKSGLLNKARKGTQVHVLAPSIQYFNSTETDSLGRFEFSGFEFPDSTLFTIKAKQTRGIKDAVDVYMDADTFPSIIDHIIRPEKLRDISTNQLEASKQKFFTENGILSFQLKDFEVIGNVSKDAEVTDLAYINSIVDAEISGERLRQFDNQPLSSLIQSLPGMSSWSEVQIMDESKIYSENSEDLSDPGPFFAWDGDIYTYAEVRKIFVGDLEAVKLMKKISAKSKSAFDDKLIVLIFKKNKGIYNSEYVVPNFERFMPLGYARTVEFYQPKYEVESVKNNSSKDWRSTLLWQAELKTNAQGKGSCWFYTADRPSKYNIVLEGITPQGEPCHFDGQYQLMKNAK